MKKLCYVATIPDSVNAFLRAHIQAATKLYDVTVVCNSSKKNLLDDIGARLIFLPIERKPAPLRDIFVLIKFVLLFRSEKFFIVHSIMPKTGLLAMLSAWICRVPVRIHTFTGQVWVHSVGVQHCVLKFFDKCIAYFATYILADSPSQRDFLIKNGVVEENKSDVLCFGSIRGVDSNRFRPNDAKRLQVRRELEISHDATVILFVGRLTRDKGVLELASCFDKISRIRHDVVLLLVGGEEDISFDLIREICPHGRESLRYVPFTATPEHFMVSADIFCLPSHREGFGMTIIEAASSGIPAVASRIYGVVDAVEEGKTGFLFSMGDIDDLTANLMKLIDDSSLRHQMGSNARIRAIEFFSESKITHELIALYAKLVENCSI